MTRKPLFFHSPLSVQSRTVHIATALTFFSFLFLLKLKGEALGLNAALTTSSAYQHRTPSRIGLGHRGPGRAPSASQLLAVGSLQAPMPVPGSGAAITLSALPANGLREFPLRAGAALVTRSQTPAGWARTAPLKGADILNAAAFPNTASKGKAQPNEPPQTFQHPLTVFLR